ncbi:phosphatase PAP2 family protein [Halobacillus mangrovi]|uniref:phosphatase PAP2 family protein n=1 Tax=Halobacillus mangrovi TaxID=402384 RepID=UPI003D98A176
MLFSGTKFSDLSPTSVFLILLGFLSLGGSIYYFIDLAAGVLQEEKFAVDQQAFDFVRATSFDGLEPILKVVTQAGSVILIAVASLALAIYLLFFSKLSRWVGIYFIVSMGGISSLTALLKSQFGRERPEFLGEYHGATSSFPSGHAAGAFVFYFFIIYLVFISHLRTQWKWIINISLALIALITGITRVYMGVHFFTDVAAGFLFGLAWLLICIIALEVTLWHQRRRQEEYRSEHERKSHTIKNVYASSSDGKKIE